MWLGACPLAAALACSFPTPDGLGPRGLPQSHWLLGQWLGGGDGQGQRAGWWGAQGFFRVTSCTHALSRGCALDQMGLTGGLTGSRVFTGGQETPPDCGFLGRCRPSPGCRARGQSSCSAKVQGWPAPRRVAGAASAALALLVSVTGAQCSELVPGGERTRYLNSETGKGGQRGHPPSVLESAGSRALHPQLTESGLRSPCPSVSGSPCGNLGREHIWVTRLGLCSARVVSSASMSDEPMVLTGCSCPAGG